MLILEMMIPTIFRLLDPYYTFKIRNNTLLDMTESHGGQIFLK